MTDTLILGLRNNPQLLQIFVDNLPSRATLQRRKAKIANLINEFFY